MQECQTRISRAFYPIFTGTRSTNVWEIERSRKPSHNSDLQVRCDFRRSLTSSLVFSADHAKPMIPVQKMKRFESPLHFASSFTTLNKARHWIRHLNIPDQMLSSSRGHRDYKDYVKYKLDLRSPTPVAALPMLGSRFHKVSLNRWWRHEPVFVHKNTSYTRNRIVLSAANKDGGHTSTRNWKNFTNSLLRVNLLWV